MPETGIEKMILMLAVDCESSVGEESGHWTGMKLAAP
jgi:hypothetical protein